MQPDDFFFDVTLVKERKPHLQCTIKLLSARMVEMLRFVISAEARLKFHLDV